MMVITSKTYLKAIHEASKKAQADKSDIAMQERVLKDLEDWAPDDCMIDGYDYSAFTPYLDLVASKVEAIKKQILTCDNCGYTYLKEEMREVEEGHYCCQTCQA